MHFTATLFTCLKLTSVSVHQAVDVSNVGGMEHVDQLAEYLVELRNQTALTLTNQQVSAITALWRNLLQYDKQRVTYSARHHDRLVTGRFRSPKKPACVPGVDGTTRCVSGASSSVSQWPDCCRLVEAIFLRLCVIFKSPRKQDGSTLTRWTLILRSYKTIRRLVLNNGELMQTTTLQLVDVNTTTLTQWHKKWLKRQNCSIMLQDVSLPPQIPVAVDPLKPCCSSPPPPDST